MDASALRLQDSSIRQSQRQDAIDRYSQEIMNNQNLSDQRKEELKQRVRNLVEPLGQELFRVSLERIAKKYGMKKYMDAIRKGDTSKLAENLVEDAKTQGSKLLAGGRADQALKSLGLKDDDIAGVKKLIQTGDPSGVKDSVINKLNENSEALLRNEDLNKSLKKLGLSQDDIKNLPQSLKNDASRIPKALDSGVQKAQDRLDNLSDEGKAQFNRLTGGQDLNTENVGEQLKSLGVPEGAQLSPENVSKYSTGDDWDDEFKLFEQQQRERGPIELGTGARTGASRAFEELRSGGTRPTIREPEAGVPFGETPKLLGGMGELPPGAGIGTPQPLSLVQRFKQFFQSNPVERGAKSAEEEPSVEERPSQTTRGFFDIEKELSTAGVSLKGLLAKPEVKESPAYKRLLEDEPLPAPSKELTDFLKRDRPESNINWNDFTLSGIGETKAQTFARQIREGTRAPPSEPTTKAPEPPTEGKFEAPKVRGGSYTRSVGGLKVPAQRKPAAERAAPTEAPALPQPSGAEEGSPADPNFLPPTLPPRRPVPFEPSGGGTNLPPPSQAQDSTQRAGDIAGEVAGGAGVLKASRSLYQRVVNRGNSQKKPGDEEEDTPDEPSVDTPDEVEPADEPSVDSITAEPTAGEADAAPQAAAKATGDIAPEASEGTTAASSAAEDIAPEVPEIVPEITGGLAASEGFVNPILDVIAGVGGLVGILAGSGVFSRKPPTPPSAKAVAENPEKFGLPAQPEPTTISAEEGGGNI